MNISHLLAVSVFFSGLLAGTEFAVRLGVAGPLDALDDRNHIVVRQRLVRTLRIIAPAFFFPAMFTASLATFSRPEPNTPSQLIGLGALTLWMTVTFAGTVPINKAALKWNPAAPPPNFAALIRQWERLALIRLLASVVAFGALTASV